MRLIDGDILECRLKGAIAFRRSKGLPTKTLETVLKDVKAVQYVPSIPEDVKTMAARKCLDIGMSPLTRPFNGDGDEG